ncbi:MAG TPA: elongation factor G [Kiritimatiellia bacterium]|nr:elongation factor G [Kiritimatiellia bacterium]HPS07212.1 elongation factor G [Kiritimatiellia bacterium]
MSEIPVSNVRNFVILGHSGSGKTTLTDAVAFKLGLNDRMGLVANGSSISDTTEEEKNRKITIFASNFTAIHKLGDVEYKMVFSDAPGFMDFYGQILGAIRAADFALITVDAVSGVQVGTRRAWKACKEGGLSSTAFVITGLDKENASFEKTLDSIRNAFGVNCVPVTAPLKADTVINILREENLPENLAALHNSLAETAAESDDTLMEKFFEKGTLEPEEISRGLVGGIKAGTVHPIYSTEPLKGIGITEMLDSMCRILPAPGSRVFTDAAGKELSADPNAPFVGRVWRTSIDTFLGQLNYVRVISGTLTTGMSVQNTSTDTKETVSAMLYVIGKKQTPVAKAMPGDIVAIPKFKNTKTGNTLTAIGSATKLPDIEFPPPVMYMAITAKTQADDDKLSTAIHRLLDGDPTLHYEKQVETKQIILKGLGDVHIDVAVCLMKSQTNVSVDLSVPKVPYRETVTALGDGHYRHKKQSGGRGQFGEVYLRVFPRREGEAGEWFVDKTVGGSIPGNFMPAVLKGVNEGMLAGSVAGFPVQGINVEVYDGSYHDVDSSEIAFKIAGSRALREGMSKAKPVLLEPVMRLKITIPEAFMGSISGDMPHKRGRVLGMEADEGIQVISAEAPLAELFKYAAELRSITGGQGSFTMDFDRYDIVPSNVAQKIIAEAAKHRKEEEEE